jgi:hypothetical protein
LLAFFAAGRSLKRPPYIFRLLRMLSRNWKWFSHTKAIYLVSLRWIGWKHCLQQQEHLMDADGCSSMKRFAFCIVANLIQIQNSNWVILRVRFLNMKSWALV